MILDIFGTKFSTDKGTKVVAEPTQYEDVAYVKKTTIYGVMHQQPYKTLEVFGVMAKEFVEKINAEFLEHNKSVDAYYNGLKESTIEKIKNYCTDTPPEIRKQYVAETFQEHVYDIKIGEDCIRLNRNQIFLFESVPTTSYNERKNPIFFDLTLQEFNELEQMFLKF